MQLKRLVAIKILHLWTSDSIGEPALKRFEREAQSLSLLKHPNIIQVYRFAYLENLLPLLILEYAEGESLREFLNRKQCLSCAEAVEIALQIAAALAFANSQGIVHRDLKPENVVLVPDDTANLPVDSKSAIETATSSLADTVDLQRLPELALPTQAAVGAAVSVPAKLRAKVLDFGLCRQAEGVDAASTLTETGLIVGSVSYMSPEQGLGEKVDQRSDIYSFGCVFYEMITGAPPFVAEHPAAVLLKHQSETVPAILKLSPRSGLPLLLDQIITKACAKSKENRYQDFSELIADLNLLAQMKNSGVFRHDQQKDVSLSWHRKQVVSICLVILFFFAAAGCFFAFTDRGKLLFASELQSAIDARSSSSYLVSLHKRFLHSGSLDAARQLVERTTAPSSIFQKWSFAQKSKLLRNYIENYSVSGKSGDAFELSLDYLARLCANIRRVQIKENAVPETEVTGELSRVCLSLYQQGHSKKEWRLISELLELNMSVFVRSNPDYLLWPAALRAKSMAESSRLDAESNREALSKMYVQAADLAQAAGNKKLLFEVANPGLKLAQSSGLLFDEHMLYSAICRYYLQVKDISRARDSLALVEKAAKNLLLSGAETGSLNRLRQACGVGKVVPVPDIPGDKGFTMRFLLGRDAK